MSKTCEVCCESFNKSTRALVTCQYCPFLACSGCAERYLCDTTQDAHCMSCRKGWTREALVKNFSQKFVSKTYKARRESLLFERERSLMPATQPFVEIEKRIRKLNTELAEAKFKIEIATREWRRIDALALAPLAVAHGLTDEFEALILRSKMASEQRKMVCNHTCDADHITAVCDRLTRRLHGGDVVGLEKRVFVRACPYADCKGFLSTAWKCGMCENWTCPECHEVKGTDRDAPHTCDANNLETARLLARDSRPCPKCASMIFKIDGCSQMWCTQCQTAFDWRTGRIENGQIHNPHYYDFMRARGTLARAPGDVPCGGMPDWRAVVVAAAATPTQGAIANSHRAYMHVQWVLIPRYTIVGAQENRDLRIKYMIGDLSDDDFKKKIQQREKARQRKTDIRQVLEMLNGVLIDLFRDFVSTGDAKELVAALSNLKTYFNDTMKDVSKRYTKCAVPVLLDNFTFV